ncbi:MAG: PSD1 domain-containing protein [Planctomycetia bacterium]|nr:PSD1 domain-containing protein [Planctomycetia bacterium]
MPRPIRYFLMVLAHCSMGISSLRAAEPDPQGIAYFEKKIRPVLVQQCYACHSEEAKKIKGGLRVDLREGLLRGGESGPAVVPGQVKDSLLIQAIQHAKADLKMPPKVKLPDAVIADFVKWVELGAPDPRGGRLASPRNLAEEGRRHWAFQPLSRVAPPAVQDTVRPGNEIDRFLVARREARRVRPVGNASPPVLLRRLYLDLIGLPPTLAEVDAFEQAAGRDRQSAITAVVDELLTRPEYGERWARHWLDVVRYADTNGFEGDGLKPNAWRYRDYVIDAFNRDKPFDRFLTEQLAGDEIDGADADSKIALTFLRLGVYDVFAGDMELHRYDQFDDVLSTVAQAFLGQTVGCARCHDHKFEPFSQKDYYRLLAVFRPLMTLGENNGLAVGSNRELEEHRRKVAELKAAQETSSRKLDEGKAAVLERLARGQPVPEGKVYTEEVLAALRADQRSPVQNKLLATLSKEIDATVASEATQDERKELEQLRQRQAEMTQAKPPELVLAHIWLEKPGTIPPTRLLKRGDPKQPLEEVSVGVPDVLAIESPAPPQALPHSSGRRLWLARWMTGPGQALVARVFVNRLWQHHFGRGLVATPNDFGLMGERPTHPELLDWLAADFIANGWKVKRLQRLMVLSRAYQLAATPDPDASMADPDNLLLWRWRTRRLEAETLRDAVLAVSGNLDSQRGGVGKDGKSSGRSVYLAVRRARSGMVPELDLLDSPDANFSTGRRNVSITPLQALTWMNGGFAQHQSRVLAARIAREAGSDLDAQVSHAFRLVLARPPRPEERTAGKAYLAERRSGVSAAQQLAAFCLVLINTNEFAYLN